MHYRDTDRGNRAAPSRSNHAYCSLVLLHRKLQQIVDSKSLDAGERVLDYGCGNKPYEALLKQKFTEYVGADLSGNREAELVMGANGQLPSPDGTFDCVVSTQTLEHVADPRFYLREAYRVLKPGGSLIVSTHGIWPYHPDPTDYWRWTIDGLQLEMRNAGFEIAVVKGILGMDTVALQLWQDATFERLPRPIQPLYTFLFQTAIRLIERRHPEKVSNDASGYIVLARKPRAMASV